MNLKIFKLFIFILYLLSPTLTYSIEHPNIKNIILYKEPKKLENIVFKNNKGEIIKLSKFRNKLVVLNFWATWCAPCREEMPSLDQLASNKNFKNISVIPINIGRESQSKSENFFNQINIKNLNIYYDSSTELPNKLSLRGVPTTILVNKNGEEFARILGAVDFKNKELISWLNKFD